MDLSESLGEPVRSPQVHGEEENVPDEGEPGREERPADERHDEPAPVGAHDGPRGLEHRQEACRRVSDDSNPDESEGGDQEARKVGSESEFWRLEGPGFVWNYRVLPHVHTYVNISSKLA